MVKAKPPKSLQDGDSALLSIVNCGQGVFDPGWPNDTD
jgi:hypothetical protein